MALPFFIGVNMDFITLEEFKAFEGINSPNLDASIPFLISGVNKLLTNLLELDNTTYITYKSNTLPLEIILPTEAASEDIDVTTADGVTLEGLTGRYGTYIFNNTYTGQVLFSYPPRFTSPPEDLKLAALMLIRFYRKDEYKNSQSGNGQSVSNVPTIYNIPRHVMSIISMYRPI